MRIINFLLAAATCVLVVGNLQAQKNPVLPGLYADPEVLYSKQTGRYYIYPTTDGQRNWTGHDFHVFESRDMKHWEEKGVVLDLRKDVSWADNNAWAPCIIERKQADGSFRYYFYYTAEGQIGGAVGTTSTGPFVDLGHVLIGKERPEGMGHGANIDPDVFQDPQTGKCYLYWGNGYLAVAELAEDMVSLVPGTTRLIITSISNTTAKGRMYSTARAGTTLCGLRTTRALQSIMSATAVPVHLSAPSTQPRVVWSSSSAPTRASMPQATTPWSATRSATVGGLSITAFSVPTPSNLGAMLVTTARSV